MDKRTTDHLKNATQKFFEDQELEQAIANYFGGAVVKQKVKEGYLRYQQLLEEAQKSAPDDMKEVAEEVTKKLIITEAAYDQEVYESLKEKITEIFLFTKIYIPIKEQLIELFNNQDDENVMQLVLSATDEITEYIINRLCNILVLVVEGIPMEIAEKIADDAGEAEVVPIAIRIQKVSDDEDGEVDDGNDGEGCTCNGECGGRCNCKGKEKCEEDGHCQCGNSSDD